MIQTTEYIKVQFSFYNYGEETQHYICNPDVIMKMTA